jgi:DNA-binding transcriptional LysR family regulator
LLGTSRFEAARRIVTRNDGVGFLPRIRVEQQIEQRRLCDVHVRELKVDCPIRLVHPARRALSHAAEAFLALIRQRGTE